MSESQALQELLDHHALRKLALRYARAIDRRDGELLRSVYHDDAVDEHGTVFRGSPAEFVAAQPELMDGFAVTSHYIMNTLYQVDGDAAQGELYFVAYHRTQENQNAADAAQEIVVGGRYLDHYVRRDGQWKIQRRRLIWDHFTSKPVAPDDLAALQRLGELGSGKNDNSSEFLPLLQRLLNSNGKLAN
jgi:hypothetical protein